MNVLLVNPSYAQSYGKMKSLMPSYPPLGLAYLASALDDQNVEILDLSLCNLTLDDFKRYLEKRNFDIVGFTATTPTINSVGRICKIVKQVDTNIVTLVGGSHPTALPERTLKENEDIDIVIIGEGEKTIKELVDCLCGNKNLNRVKGICYRKGNEIIRTKSRSLIKNLDSIPLPRHDMLRLKSYTYWLQHGKKFSPISTSRGCPYSCNFCCKSVFGSCYRVRSVENVLNEIELLVELGVDEIHIVDDNFAINRKRASEILGRIRRDYSDLHIAFINGVRADTVSKDLLIKMKKANTYFIGYGVESGDQEVLKLANKNLPLTQVENAVWFSKKIGIEIVACFFILGLFGQTQRSIVNSMKFVRKLNPDFAKFSILVPYPGTKIYEDLKELGRIKTNNWDEYVTWGFPVFEHESLTSYQLIYWTKKLYKEFYLAKIPNVIKILMRNPKLVKNIFKILPNFLEFITF